MEPTRAPALRDGPLGLPDGDFVMVEWGDPGGVTGPDRPIAGLHVHHADDEAWYVLEGTLGFRVGDELVEAGPGAAVLVPRGTPHTFWNARPEPARYLLVMTPRIERLVRDLHATGASDYGAIFRAHESELL
ncbi:MAG TPA: cupin domain-containing protein [Gaiellales bacterium]|nr:cupin domain-containing protein [Gaiellales bacterium]